jgi:hypothetical protein
MANHVSTKIRKQAIKLFGEGYAATTVAKQLGVTAQSVRVWARAAGVEKGKLLEKQLREAGEELDTPAPAPMFVSPEQRPLIKALVQQQQNEAIQQAVDTGSSAIEQFQMLVAAKGIKLLSEAFEAPPRPKNVRDLKTLSDMVGDALGISRKGGAGGRLAIDLTVLTKPQNQLTIDVESDGR